MRLTLAQLNPTVSDLAGNRDRIIAGIEAAQRDRADLILFPELCVVGYPPRDLVLKPRFIADARQIVDEIARACGPHLTAIVGFPEANTASHGRPLFNSAAICRDGRVVSIHRKALLPTYDVFDESRYFEPGRDGRVIELPASGGAVRTGVTICEDLWNDSDFVGRPLYHVNPLLDIAAAGVRIVVNISASPFSVEKQAYRERLFGGQASKHRLPIVVVNQVGGNDDILFDGASCAFDAAGKLVARARAFDEDFLTLELTDRGLQPGRIEPNPDPIASIHAALVLGTRDYMRKCGFKSAVVGLSGGIDSAVVACLAVDALGAAAVHGVAMPSRYSSDHSIEDARALARNLGIQFDIIPIEDMHRAAESTLAGVFTGRQPDTTEENVQARIRGNILMSLSNKFGRLLLTTGNKSELAVGYCTLYGDMCGGLAVISDVPKTTVYALGREINRRAGRELIPQRTFDKPPSAELKPNQTDQDSLPPYDLLDAILQRYIEDERSAAEIIAEGFDAAVVNRVARLVDRNEYKRRQAAPGLKVTSRAFGTGRRMPIAIGTS